MVSARLQWRVVSPQKRPGVGETRGREVGASRRSSANFPDANHHQPALMRLFTRLASKAESLSTSTIRGFRLTGTVSSNLLVTSSQPLAPGWIETTMHPTIASFCHRIQLTAVTLCACLVLAPAALHAQSSTGTITGRVLNEGTGQYLRSAVVTVVGTNITTLAESGGVYTLTGVPAGQARVSVAYAGLDPAETTVIVAPGQTVTQDFAMGTKSDSTVVKMGEFRVVTEREGNFQAIQEQKSALEIKSVVSSDAYGDVSEGNIGEFMKLMPGVMMDYVDADVRTVSIGGLDPKYAVIMMDGAPVASAGSSNIAVGRAFEFEQLSISSIETVEMSKTPTPDVSGSALAGVINLRSKGAFDRKGRQIRWSASSQLNSYHMTLKRTAGPADTKIYKFQPNATLEFSDVFLDNRLGVLAGFSYARTLVEQNNHSYTYVFNNDPADNATEIPRLSTFALVDAPKTTNRTNYNLRLDYKVSNDLMVWARADYNDYSARNFQHNVTFRFNNAVNGPAASDPRTAGVNYSLTSQTSTSATSELLFANAFNKHGATTTVATGGFYKRGAFRVDAQGQMSRSTNYYHDLIYGFVQGGSSGQLPGLTLRWDRSTPGDVAINITQLGGPDWRNPANYTAPANPSNRLPFTSKDQKWTAKSDFRYNWALRETPILFKWGGDISQQVRNVDRGTIPTYTYLGPDGRAGTGDEGWSIEPYYRARNVAGGNLQGIPSLDRFAMAREMGAHPERFVQPTPQALLMSALTTHWDVKEQIDSAYQQTIIKVTKKFDIAPGVRLEKTRSSGRGPTDRGDDYAKKLLTGNPNANIPTTSLEYIQARYGSDAINSADYHTWLKYLHATYRLTSDIIFRASFNDSITRAPLDNLAGGIAINPDAAIPTARIPNPEVRPEHGRNMFASAEYYFPKRAGFFMVSVARRDIEDLIRTTTFDVPLNETYPNQESLDLAGYRVTTTDNVGRSHVGTAEFSYRQNLVFLPGLWQRLSLFGSYTRLRFDDYENFRRPTNLASGGISFDHRGLSLRWNVVWVPIFRTGAIPANGWVVMEGERLMHDVQFSYRFSSRLTAFINGRNVFNHKQRGYYGPGRTDFVSRHGDNGTIWTVGLRGVY
jgi:TonB-dependent receptor